MCTRKFSEARHEGMFATVVPYLKLYWSISIVKVITILLVMNETAYLD